MNDSWIQTALDDVAARGERRAPAPWRHVGAHISDGSRTLVNLGGNDYLALATHPRVVQAASAAALQQGAGATASRLICGSMDLHLALEREVADFKGYPACLMFGSGYLASLGGLPALVGRDDHVFADRLVHACLIDAIRLSGATLHRFHHNDANHLADLLARHRGAGRALLVTETVFSMDGDIAPLSDIADLASRHEAMLWLDDAHATGVHGPAGAGLSSLPGVRDRVTVAMGTFSKALGGYGGFLALTGDLRELLLHRGRTFVFSTAPPPASVAAARAALAEVRAHPEWGPTLLARAAAFRADLQRQGLDTMGSTSQIVPVLIGDNQRAVRVGQQLNDMGYLVGVVRPPSVPPGTARLRLSLSLGHDEAELRAAASAIAQAVHHAS